MPNLGMTIDEMVARIKTASSAYYNSGTSDLSDQEFDMLVETLRAIDPDHPVLAAIGAPAVSDTKAGDWPKVKHLAPMGSLNKAQSIDELNDFIDKVTLAKGKSIAVSLKFDGASLSCKYLNGKLVQAVTRGDGLVGDDITPNVLLMQGVKANIPGFSGHLRGEIILRKQNFALHFPGGSNCRNVAVGTAKRQSNPEKCKYLDVFFYQVLPSDKDFDADLVLPTKQSERAWLKQNGMQVGNGFWIDTDRCKLHIAGEYEKFIKTERDLLDFEIDGLVIEIDDNDQRDAMGEHAGRPKGGIALKFPHASGETTLRGIDFQVGKSGRITPVAVFDTIKLAGADVERASLANLDEIQRIWGAGEIPCVGDKVVISRRNDVIPKLESVAQYGRGAMIHNPTSCPSCGFDLERDGAYLVCPNGLSCKAQRVGAIERWVEKVGILDWGSTAIEALVSSGKVNDIADCYALTAPELAALQLNGRVLGSTANVMVANLHAKKELPLHTLVGSLGIPLMGRSMVKVLIAAGWDSVDKMQLATVPALAKIPGMGQGRANAFVKGFPEALYIINRLGMAGVTTTVQATGSLTGKSFCFTGIRDKPLEDRIEAEGGSIKGSVGKGLTILVAKLVDTTSGKGLKAAQLGVKVISLAEAWALVGSKP